MGAETLEDSPPRSGPCQSERVSDDLTRNERIQGWTLVVCGAMVPPAMIGRYFSTGTPIWAESSNMLVNVGAPFAIVLMTAALVMIGAMTLGWSTSTRAISVTTSVTLAFMGLLGLLYVVAPDAMIENSRRGPNSPTGARVLGAFLVAGVTGAAALLWRLRGLGSER